VEHEEHRPAGEILGQRLQLATIARKREIRRLVARLERCRPRQHAPMIACKSLLFKRLLNE
jgi:hypothetical protein